jgi:hypothetical protein
MTSRPVQVSAASRRYLEFRGRPTLLITSAEHYGAVVNLDFDYIRYLDRLAQYELNYTRIYPGAYFEVGQAFHPHNVLAPLPGRHCLPWARSAQPGYSLGGNLFDLDTWDPTYFERLHAFLEAAGDRDIVVEVCLFNAAYADSWPWMPLYHDNNVQRIGTVDYRYVQTLRDPALVEHQARYVRKIAAEVNRHDNVILELCDEPGLHVPPYEYGPWLDRMIAEIREAEAALPNRLLLAQQVCGVMGGEGDFSLDQRVDIATGQYVERIDGGQIGGIALLDHLWDGARPIELNESAFFPRWYGDPADQAWEAWSAERPDAFLPSDGHTQDALLATRAEAWEFIVGGGAAYNQLNAWYSSVDPSGDHPQNHAVAASLRTLRRFMEGFEFWKMRPTPILDGVPTGAFARAFEQRGRQYALYIHHSELIRGVMYLTHPGSYREVIRLGVPEGRYRVEWVDPATGGVLATNDLDHPGGMLDLPTPTYSFDLALRMLRVEGE